MYVHQELIIIYFLIIVYKIILITKERKNFFTVFFACHYIEKKKIAV